MERKGLGPNGWAIFWLIGLGTAWAVVEHWLWGEWPSNSDQIFFLAVLFLTWSQGFIDDHAARIQELESKVEELEQRIEDLKR